MNTVLITGRWPGHWPATAEAFMTAGWRVLALDKAFGAAVVGERMTTT